jgi:hypothetical protein
MYSSLVESVVRSGCERREEDTMLMTVAMLMLMLMLIVVEDRLLLLTVIVVANSLLLALLMLLLLLELTIPRLNFSQRGIQLQNSVPRFENCQAHRDEAEHPPIQNVHYNLELILIAYQSPL